MNKTGRNCRIFAGLMLTALIIWLLPNSGNVAFKLGVGSLTVALGFTGLIGIVFLGFYLVTPSVARLTQALLIITCPIALAIKWLFGINLIASLENLINSIQQQKGSDYNLLLGLSLVLIIISSIGCKFLISLL